MYFEELMIFSRERGKVLRNWEKKWKRERISHLFKSPQWGKKQRNSFIKTQYSWLLCLFPNHQPMHFSLNLQYCSNGMWFNNNQFIIFNNKLILRTNWVSDELTFNPSDNDVAPESPILLQMECDSIIIN